MLRIALVVLSLGFASSFVCPAVAQDADMFAEKPATEAKASSSASPLSIFDEAVRDEGEPAEDVDPLNQVVTDWLKADKAGIDKEIETQKKTRSSVCRFRPTDGLYLTQNFVCNNDKLRNGFSCAAQNDQYKERMAEWRRRRAEELKKKQAAWDRICANYNPNSNEPDEQLQARLAAVNREIEAEMDAARKASFASLKQRQAREEQNAYAERDAEEQAKKAQAQRKREEMEAQRREREEEQAVKREAERKECRAWFFEKNNLLCGCSWALQDVDLSRWKACSK